MIKGFYFQMPNLSAIQLPLQSVPGLGNIQVISASALAQSQVALSPLQSQQAASASNVSQANQITTVSDLFNIQNNI